MTAPEALRTLQIGLIASPRQTSGSDRYYFNLLRALREDGVGVSGVVLGDPLSVEDGVAGVVSFAPEGVGPRKRWQGLRRTIRTRVRDTDVVVSHLAPHVFPVLDIVRSKPLVEHFHGPWALEGQFNKLPARRIALRLVQEHTVYRRAARIIVLSRSFGDVLERKYRIAPEKIRLIPGGVDLARFAAATSRRDAREQLNIGRDRPVLLTVRRLEPSKGVDSLIAAIDLVRRKSPEVLVIVAGTGSLAVALADQVARLNLASNVRFAGKVDDAQLALLYRAADMSVVPSQAWEGFGLVCVESLASGTPVMVTPIGGLPEVVSDLEPALVFNGTSVQDIATGLSDALQGRLPLPSEVACLQYVRRFAWSAIADRVRDVYREVA